MPDLYDVADYLEEIEADDDHNDKQRAIIDRFRTDAGADYVYLVTINCGNREPIRRSYPTDFVYNFDADAVIQSYDERLDVMLKWRASSGYVGKLDHFLITCIIQRIDQLGGRLLVWT